MPRTFVAVFDERAAAQRAIEALARDGFDKRHVRATQTRAPEGEPVLHGGGAPPVAAEVGIVPDTASAYVVPFPIEAGVMPVSVDPGRVDPMPEDDDGVLGHIRSFFAELFGPTHVLGSGDVERYTDTMRRGGAIVRVEVEDDAQAGRARADLEAAGAVHLEEIETA